MAHHQQWQGVDIDKRFHEASNIVRSWKQHPKEQHFIEMHALFKQATEGDCNISKPCDEFKAKEWEAWELLKGTPKIEAMKLYITRTNDLDKKYETENPQVPKTHGPPSNAIYSNAAVNPLDPDYQRR